MLYIYLMLMFYKSGQVTRLLTNIFNLLAGGIVLYYVYNYVSSLVMNFHGRFDLLGDAETISSTSRALQYVVIYDKMHEAPFFGFGRMRNFIELIEGAIDNYYFWLILEVGIIGILVYFLFLYTLVRTALNQYKLPDRNYYLLPILISILLSIFYMVLSSAPDVLIYLYIFAGLICVMKILPNKKQIIT